MSWRMVSAQTMRAFACSLGPVAFAGSLLASATTTTIRGLRAILRRSPPDVLLEGADFSAECCDPIEEKAGEIAHRVRQRDRLVADRLCQPDDPGGALGRDHAKLSEMSPERVDRLGSLTDQEIARAKQHALALLLRRFNLDEPHGRT